MSLTRILLALSFVLKTSVRVSSFNTNGSIMTDGLDPDSEELNSREFLAADVQMLSDWVTAINTASCAEITEPIAHLYVSFIPYWYWICDLILFRNVVDQMRTTHVILIRHGQYNHVAGNVPDSYKTLTGLGQEQADLTGKFLAQYLADRMVNDRFPAVTIYHSDLTRAKQTAQCIAKHFTSPEMLENVLLREAWPCAPLPTSNKVVAAEKQQVMVADTSRLKVAFRTFFKHVNPKDLRRPSVQLTDDKVSTFNKNFDPKSTSVRIGDRYRIIVCHANIIRWFVCKSLGVDAEGTWGRMRYNHCGLTEIDVDALGNLQLGFFNQAAHLPSHMCTET